MTRPLLVARLSGGPGNQMFIYAAARRLAIKNDAELALDQTNGFVNDPYQRFFQLDLFKLKARNATPREAMQPFNKMRRKLAIHRNKKRPFSQRDFIKQNGVDMEPALLDAKLGPYTYLEGYWQGEPYFADIADIICQDFQLARQPNAPNMAMLDTIKQYEMPVALHVRFFAPPGAEKMITLRSTTIERPWRHWKKGFPIPIISSFQIGHMMRLRCLACQPVGSPQSRIMTARRQRPMICG